MADDCLQDSSTYRADGGQGGSSTRVTQGGIIMDKTQQQIEILREKVYEVYDTIEQKGGTIPEELTVGNMPNAIRSIQGGGGSADLTNYYTKEQTDANIEEVASVTARAVYEIKNSIGASDELKVSFDGTKHLSSAKSIMDALHVLDEGIESEELNNRISAIESSIATMQKTLTSLSAMFGGMISITAEGADGSYTMALVGSYGGGGGKSRIEGSALIAAGEIENNALVLTGATIEGSALYL